MFFPVKIVKLCFSLRAGPACTTYVTARPRPPAAALTACCTPPAAIRAPRTGFAASRAAVMSANVWLANWSAAAPSRDACSSMSSTSTCSRSSASGRSPPQLAHSLHVVSQWHAASLPSLLAAWRRAQPSSVTLPRAAQPRRVHTPENRVNMHPARSPTAPGAGTSMTALSSCGWKLLRCRFLPPLTPPNRCCCQCCRCHRPPAPRCQLPQRRRCRPPPQQRRRWRRWDQR